MSVGTVLLCVSAAIYVALLVFVTASQSDHGFGPFLPDAKKPKAGRIIFAALLQLVFALWCTAAVFRVLDFVGLDLAALVRRSGHVKDATTSAASGGHSRSVARIAAGYTWFLTCGIVAYMALYFTHHTEVHRAFAPPVVVQFVLFFPMIVVFFLPWPLGLFGQRLAVLRVVGESVACVVGWPVLGPVDFAHVLITDALTSATLWIYELEFSVCHFATTPWGEYNVTGADSMVTTDHCGPHSRNNLLGKPILYTLPFWLRFVQCCYQFVQAHRDGQRGWARNQCAVNAAKYVSAIAVVITSSLITGGETSASSLLWIGCLVIKTLFCFAWDIGMDWGLVSRRADDSWGLRPARVFPPLLYAVVTVFNLFGRVSWSLAISPHFCNAPCALSLGVLEIARRAAWAVLRVEWQHLKTAAPSRLYERLQDHA